MSTDDVDAQLSEAIEAINTFFLIWGAAQVFFMQAGFSMLEVGSVQENCTINVLLKNTFDASLSVVCWGLIGHTIAFGGSDASGIFPNFSTYPIEKHGYGFWLFQWSFASTASTIVSGAVAERIKFRAYVVYAIFTNLVTYPMVVHWVWSEDGVFSASRNQALNRCGVLDFAGSGVVHYTGGLSALLAIYILGKRHSVSFEDGRKKAPLGQSDSLKTVGTLTLWYGWFGFNGASTLTLVGGAEVAARAVVMTAISGGMGGITSGLLCAFLSKSKQMNLSDTLNGILVGLVGITANCATVQIEGAFLIGIGSSLFYNAATRIMHKLELDDVVGAVEVHMAGGIWALIAGGFFTVPEYYKEIHDNDPNLCSGLFYGGSGGQMGANLMFLIIHTVWVIATVGTLFYVMNHFNMLRVAAFTEKIGIDALNHNTMIEPIDKEMDRIIAPVLEEETLPSRIESSIDEVSATQARLRSAKVKVHPSKRDSDPNDVEDIAGSFD